jgi:hypothetical protein
MQNKKYWRWNHPNWSNLWVVEADQRFVKYATEGRFLDILQTFDLFLRLTKLTNFDNANANIFIFHLVILLSQNYLDITFQRWGCHKSNVNGLRKWWIGTRKKVFTRLGSFDYLGVLTLVGRVAENDMFRGLVQSTANKGRQSFKIKSRLIAYTMLFLWSVRSFSLHE